MENKTELLTASEVLLKHELNWEVEKRPVYDNNGKELADFKAVTRKDNGQVFQICRNRYETINNAVACSLLDEVVGTGMAKYIGAKSFKAGALVMVNAEVPELEYRIGQGCAGDTIKNYIHIATSHDGSSSGFIFGSQQRFICQNLLTVAMKRDVCTLKFKHTQNYKIRIDEFKEVFKVYREAFARQREVFEALARKQMNQLELDSFLDKLLNIDSNDLELVSTRAKNIKQEIGRLFVDGIGHSELEDTRWKAYNAITQYVSHEKSTRGDESNRDYSNYFSGGAKLRQKALELLA